jgi:hypothetical protein
VINSKVLILLVFNKTLFNAGHDLYNVTSLKAGIIDSRGCRFLDDASCVLKNMSDLAVRIYEVMLTATKGSLDTPDVIF